MGLIATILTTLLLTFACAKAKDAAPLSAPVATYSLTIAGTGFDPHIKQTIHAALYDRTLRKVAATGQALIADSGIFTLVIADVLLNGRDYYLDTYVDMDGNKTCDPPPTDHGWRTKVDQVTGDVSRTIAHHMGLEDVCASFAASATEAASGTAVTVSGTLNLSDAVSGVSGLTPGQTLEGATVFLESLPDQEARSDGEGNFTLKLAVPATALTSPGTSGRLIMWYTVPGDAANPFKWTPAAARFGTTKDVDLAAGGTILLGKQSLTFTKAMVLPVQHKDTQRGLNGCWVRIPKLGFQLTVVNSGDGLYLIDYLPPQSYSIDVQCNGAKPQTITRTVSSASAAGQQETVETVLLAPL